jgi:ribonuclease P protein component
VATAIGRLQRPVDFERLLSTPSCARSAHFAVHHTSERPASTQKGPSAPPLPELSTDAAHAHPQVVDDLPDGWWLGLVVPKRHARRAVTRSLLKRQIRVAMLRHAPSVAPGVWVVRLRAPLDRKAFVSAASVTLKHSMAAELDALLLRCRPKTGLAGISQAVASP